MKENDSGRENNYALICAWRLGSAAWAGKVKMKGDLIESVVCLQRVATGCGTDQRLGWTFSLARWGCLLRCAAEASQEGPGESVSLAAHGP